MKADWRAIFGPALTTAVALIAFYVDRQFVTVPNPAPLFVCIVALASSLSGMASGLVSAVIAVISSALFFLHHRAVPGYDAHDVARMALLAMTAGGTAIITGMLRQKWVDAFASEQELHATSARLAAALDQVDIGVVLLDSDTRAEFINRAFRDYFSLPRNEDIVEKLQAFAQARGHTLLELAFSWLASRPQVSSVIAGATRVEQVEQNVKAIGWTLSAEEMAEIDKITT